MHIVGVTGATGAGKDIIASRLVEKHGYIQIPLADPIKRFGLNVFGFDVVQLWGSAKNTYDPMFNECNIRSSGVPFEPGCRLASVKRQCDQAWGDAALRLTSYGPQWVNELVPVQQQEQALKDLYFWFASLGHHYPSVSPRIMLQSLGTEWGRHCVSEDIWVNKMLSISDSVYRGFSYDKETGLSTSKNLGRPTGVVVSDIRYENEVEMIKKFGGKLLKVTRESADRKSKKVGIIDHASEDVQKGFSDELFDSILQNNGTVGDLTKAVDIVAKTLKSNLRGK